MKKVFKENLIWLISLSLILFSVSFVFAQETNSDQAGEIFAQETNFERVGKTFANIATKGLDLFGLGQDTLTILLLGLLLWMILYSVVKKIELFEENPLWSGVIALISTILAFIFLKGQATFLKLISGEFGALGGTILVVFPFLLAIYFTSWVCESLFVAKAIWAVFVIYYLTTFFSIWGSSTYTSFNKDTLWYLTAFISSIILFIFIPLIRKGFWDVEIKAIKEKVGRRVKKAGVGVRAAEKLAEEFSEGEGI